MILPHSIYKLYNTALKKVCRICVAWLLIAETSVVASVPKEDSLIRDAEIEYVLKSYIEPLFLAANITSKRFHLYIIQSKTINAFAMAGNKIGIHTELLLRAESPSQLIGVLAHETAHIADSHVIRGVDAFEKTLLQGLIGTIGGIGAALAGRPDAGLAILMGSQELAKRDFLKFSRTQEGSADQGAARILDHLGYSSQGMLEFLQIMHKNDFLVEEHIDPYAITHPLTSERIAFFVNHVAHSPHSNATLPQQFEDNFKRMQVKLAAFLQSPAKTFDKYKPTDTSLLARYARSIAYLQSSQNDMALDEINHLLADYPEDAFFWDLKGQILFDSGKIKEASYAYEQAVKLRPDIALLRVTYAHALIETGENQLLKKAFQELLRAKAEEPDNPMTYRLLAVCYGKKGDIGLASLSLAEMAFEVGDLKMADEQVKRSLKLLKGKPTDISRANHLLQEIKRLKDQSSSHGLEI